MAENILKSPKRGDAVVGKDLRPTFQVTRFFEEIARRLNNDLRGLDAFDLRITALEPQYVPITSADSPYQANDMDYILCDMDGDIDVLVPDSGRFWVSRDGASNELTIVGTINDTVDPQILFDGTSRTFAKIIDDWRVMR